MNPHLVGFLFIVAGYLIGSISFGLIIGKIIKGIDIREYGSGSTGATNVLRTCGVFWGLMALVLDMMKAAVPVALAVHMYNTPSYVHPFIGLSAILGHVKPIFTGFQGGKGIASGWASLIILSPWSGLTAILFAGPIMWATRYVSLGSMVGSTVGAWTLIVFSIFDYCPGYYSIFGFVGWITTIYLHKENIKRLIEGTERKMGQREANIKK